MPAAAGQSRPPFNPLHWCSHSPPTLASTSCRPCQLSHSSSTGWDDIVEEHPRDQWNTVLRPKEWSKVLLLLATFLAALTYVAGSTRRVAFGTRKTTAAGELPTASTIPSSRHTTGVTSRCSSTATPPLFIIVLLLGKDFSGRVSPSLALQVFVFGALLVLLAAYSAGQECYTSTIDPLPPLHCSSSSCRHRCELRRQVHRRRRAHPKESIIAHGFVPPKFGPPPKGSRTTAMTVRWSSSGEVRMGGGGGRRWRHRSQEGWRWMVGE